jgi:hypothetical protein
VFEDLAFALTARYSPPLLQTDAAKSVKMAFSGDCEEVSGSHQCQNRGKLQEDAESFIGAQFSVNDRLAIINAAYGYEPSQSAFEDVTLSKNATSALRPVTFNWSSSRAYTEAETWSWISAWCFIAALVAATIKSFRLIGVQSANYVFAAIVGVAAVVMLGFLSDELLALAAKVGERLGIAMPSIKISTDWIFVGYFLLALCYSAWALLKRRTRHWERVMSYFNMFFLLVLSVYIPLFWLPGWGVTDDLPETMQIVLWFLYFGVFLSFGIISDGE